MGLTAPPPVQDPAPRDVDDAVIKEAEATRPPPPVAAWRGGRRRAGRPSRRSWPGNPRRPRRARHPLPRPLSVHSRRGAPARIATLVAAWGQVHWGWVRRI